MRSVAYFLAPILAFVLTLAPIASTQQQLPIPNTPGSGQGESRPSPDPTRLTTEQLIREINSVREIFAGPIDAIKKEQEVINARLEKVSDLIDKRVLALQSLNEERFASIALQFKERDVRGDQSLRDNQTKVDAAFQAAKEAVNTALSSAKEAVAAQQASAALAISKSEAGTSKQIDQLANLFDTSMKGTNGKVDDLKARLGLLEGSGLGSKEYRDTSQGNVLYLFGILGGVIGVASFVYTLVKHKA